MNKFEKFALAMSVLLFELRIEDINNSVLFDDDGEQIPVDFIDAVLDDPEHQKAIKERLRLSVLEDVTRFPMKYVEKRTGTDTREYVYSTDVYDHAYLVDNYIEALYADTQKKTVYICSHCNSDNVQVQAWVRPNQGMQYVDEVAEGDVMGWCDDENLSSVIDTAEVKRRHKVVGFQVESDDGKHEIHPHMDGSFCLYSLEQARAMMDDDNNGDEQWKLLAIWDGDVEEPTMMFEGDPRNPDEMILP
jgi:hypothetical protein